MNSIVAPVASHGIVLSCPKLRLGLSHLTKTAIVQICAPTSAIFLSTRLEGSVRTPQNATPEGFTTAPGPLLSCAEILEDDAIYARLAPLILPGAEPSIGSGHKWHQFGCTFANGDEDRLVMQLTHALDASVALGFLKNNWPALREDCLRDACETAMEVCDKAMHWMVASRMNVAMFVMNGRGAMLRANAAAQHLLQAGTVLRRSPAGICCSNQRQTSQFLALLAKCATADPCGPEKVMFIDAETPAIKIPVTMARYWHDNAATDLVTVMVPMPPDSRRVEMLARAVGLTPAEARVASLMQMGLSNKDAARISGLKEQSVSTYAKRVLSKLNVTSRAEMAQMLTWQSAGGSL